MSEKEKIDKLIAEADKKTPPKRLFQYTSLGVLALILQNRTIRFNSLENLDDLEESSLHFCDDNPPVTYVSCWTDIIKESIPMWKLYTQMHDGVRIELPIGPFNDPRGSDGNRSYYDADISDAAISKMQVVVSPMFSDSNYLLLDALLKKYDYGIKFKESALKGKIKLK